MEYYKQYHLKSNCFFALYTFVLNSVYLNSTNLFYPDIKGNENYYNNLTNNYYLASQDMSLLLVNKDIFYPITNYVQSLEKNNGANFCQTLYQEYFLFSGIEDTYSMKSTCSIISNGIMNSNINSIEAKVIKDLRYSFLSFTSSSKNRSDLINILTTGDTFNQDFIILDSYLRKLDEVLRLKYVKQITDTAFAQLSFYTIVLFIINIVLEIINIFLIKYLIVNYIQTKIRFYCTFTQSLLVSRTT